jgi:hypothetical protein
MALENENLDMRQNVIDAKNASERKFKTFTGNFYILKSALRYFSVKKGMSFTSSKLANNFPVSATIAGSSLRILNDLGVVQARTESSSPDRYMPKDVNLNKMEKVEEILIENFEIKDFNPD